MKYQGRKYQEGRENKLRLALLSVDRLTSKRQTNGQVLFSLGLFNREAYSEDRSSSVQYRSIQQRRSQLVIYCNGLLYVSQRSVSIAVHPSPSDGSVRGYHGQVEVNQSSTENDKLRNIKVNGHISIDNYPQDTILEI